MYLLRPWATARSAQEGSVVVGDRTHPAEAQGQQVYLQHTRVPVGGVPLRVGSVPICTARTVKGLGISTIHRLLTLRALDAPSRLDSESHRRRIQDRMLDGWLGGGSVSFLGTDERMMRRYGVKW